MHSEQSHVFNCPLDLHFISGKAIDQAWSNWRFWGRFLSDLLDIWHFQGSLDTGEDDGVLNERAFRSGDTDEPEDFEKGAPWSTGILVNQKFFAARPLHHSYNVAQ